MALLNTTPAMPEQGAFPVVITRPAPQAGKLAARLSAAGRPVVLLPLLEIHPLADQAGLAAALAGVASYDLVAFVSPNAIDAAFAHIPAWPAAVSIAVLGEGSRAALLKHGVDPGRTTILSPNHPTRSDSENLLESMDLDALRGKRVLIVRGESGRELMADGMRAAGAQVDTLAAYRRTTPSLTPQLSRQLMSLADAPHEWVVTSSEAMRGLHDLAQKLAIVAKLQQQHFIVPHARIEQTARRLGYDRLTLTGSGDEAVFAALQSRP
jgi:uroporphyrinogen-III synthase